jgi:hypothetical protein
MRLGSAQTLRWWGAEVTNVDCDTYFCPDSKRTIVRSLSDSTAYGAETSYGMPRLTMGSHRVSVEHGAEACNTRRNQEARK